MASAANELEQPRPMARQSTDIVLMIRPASFSSNPQTSSSNAFQTRSAPVDAVGAAARAEFDEAVDMLRGAGVTVLVLDDEPEPPRPDAVFPNNWFSTHADGSVVLYPMQAPNRRIERRPDLLRRLSDAGLAWGRLIDLSGEEREGRFLEGTGSMVLDRMRRVAFACRSPRTDESLLRRWGDELGYRVVSFDAVDHQGRAIYHTNVVMCIGNHWSAVCLDAIPDPVERAMVAAELAAEGRERIELTMAQMDQFCGNMLELEGRDGRRLVVMSERARRALGPRSAMRLARHAEIVACAIPTIETVGGGSLRCMIAEVFLPRGARPDA